jgi:hypothetical protein
MLQFTLTPALSLVGRGSQNSLPLIGLRARVGVSRPRYSYYNQAYCYLL